MKLSRNRLETFDVYIKVIQGHRTLRPPEKDITTKCEHLHFNDAFLRLLPFRMETANDEGNYIGVVRGLMSEQEVERMKEKAKGNMKATPYQVGNQDHEFSYKRSSKVRIETIQSSRYHSLHKV